MVRGGQLAVAVFHGEVRHWRVAVAAAALALASSCTCGVVANPEGARCDVGNVCPGGYVCIGGFCRSFSGQGGGSATGGGGGEAGGPAGGNAGAGGGSVLCDGVVCNMPPAPACLGNMLRTFAGACNPGTGSCDYAPMDTACPNACSNGQCTGATCTGVVCTTPPPPTCSGNTLRTFSMQGQCSNGMCQYPDTSLQCPNGCANGACVPMAATFAQTLPRVRHAITAVDMEPGTGGDDVLVVGPMGAASRWNGTQWSAVATGMNGNLSSVWFSAPNTAYLVGETGLLRLTGTTTSTVSRVTGLPPMTGNSRLIDVHGISDTNYAVVDDTGTIYRFNANAWSTSSGNTTTRDKPPYRMRGVFMEPAPATTTGSRLRYYGTCGTPAGGCIVFQTSTNGSYFDDQDTASAGIRSVASSLELNGSAWAGLDIPQLRRHDVAGAFDSTSIATGLDGGAVVAMAPSSSTVTRATFILTAPDKVVGGLYRASGLSSAPSNERLMDTLYGYQAMSKNESSGVIVVDMNTTSNTSTIIRRGPLANEVLDLGAEDWIAGSSGATGLVLMNPYGDVALITNGMSTFQLRRYPFNLDATDIAAGSTYVLITAADGTALRLSVAGVFTELSFATKPTGLNAVCRASDSEWYLAGMGGQLFAYDGTMTRSMTSPTTTELNDVDCPGAGAAVACGNGTVLRLTAMGWVSVPGAPAGAITQCKLGQGGAIYVAGPNLFARFSNGTWQNLPARPTLDGLVVKSVNEAYAADGRTLVRFDGTTWQTVTMAPQALLAGFLVGQRVVMAGSGGVVMEGQ